MAKHGALLCPCVGMEPFILFCRSFSSSDPFLATKIKGLQKGSCLGICPTRSCAEAAERKARPQLALVHCKWWLTLTSNRMIVRYGCAERCISVQDSLCIHGTVCLPILVRVGVVSMLIC